MKLRNSLIVGLIGLFVLNGCYDSPALTKDSSYDRTKTGVATGAIAGALLGYNSKGGNKNTKALIGALMGATVGGAIGYSLDNQANEIAKALGTGVNNDPLASLDPNKDLIVSKTPTYVKIMFRDPMMFASGSASLQSRARANVSKVGRLLSKYPKTVVAVAGFTDNSGSYDYNRGLSQRRAMSVANLLSINGRPYTKGCSFDKAIAPNTTARNKALNRRVEVYLYSNKNNMSNPCN